jgi:hypothetical protein
MKEQYAAQENDRSADSGERERALHELESYSPEGESPSRRTLARERMFFAPIAVVAFIGGAIALHAISGWRAVVVGVIVFVVYIAVGWWPEFAAAALRRGEHQKYERELDDRTRSPHGHASQRPKG